MAEYRNTDGTTTIVEKRSNAGVMIGLVIAFLAIIVALLFLTGFWSADVTKSGSLPDVKV